MLMYKKYVEHWHNNNTQLNYKKLHGNAEHKQGSWDSKLVHFCDVESVVLINKSGIVC